MAFIPPELDQTTKGLIQDQYQSAINSSPEQMTKDIMSQSFAPQFDAPKGFEAGEYEAISRKANEAYKRGMGTLGADVAKKNLQVDFNKKLQAGELLRKEQDYNIKVQQAKDQAKRERKAARAGVLGSILGIGGAVAGGFAGGPTGAMAGAQIGAGAGSAFGG